MIRWSSDILKQIRPHHLTKAILNPKRAIRELKYRYTFTRKVPFCVFLTGVHKEIVCSLFKELYAQSNFINLVKKSYDRLRPVAGRGAMGDEVDLLYVVTRLLRPQLILETGIGAGISSEYMLKALQHNGSGRLYSIDLPDEAGLSGWAVPTELNKYWDKHLGASSLLLKPLLREIGSFDIFVHDSDHSYENMMYEFRTVWPFLKKGGLFLAHDIGRNDALFDFCSEVGISWARVRTYHVLGGLRKNEKTCT